MHRVHIASDSSNLNVDWVDLVQENNFGELPLYPTLTKEGEGGCRKPSRRWRQNLTCSHNIGALGASNRILAGMAVPGASVFLGLMRARGPQSPIIFLQS